MLRRLLLLMVLGLNSPLAIAQETPDSMKPYVHPKHKAPFQAFYIMSSQNDELCNKILHILNLPINKDFGTSFSYDTFNTIENQKSEFALPADEHEIQWVKWEEWKEITRGKLRQYTSDEKLMTRWLADSILTKEYGPYRIYEATIDFPNEEGSKHYQVPMLLAQATDIRYANRDCMMSETNPVPFMPLENIKWYNHAYYSTWCGYFKYEELLYKSDWSEMLPSRPLKVLQHYFDSKEDRISQKGVCEFAYKYKRGE